MEHNSIENFFGAESSEQLLPSEGNGVDESPHLMMIIILLLHYPVNHKIVF